MIPIQLKIKGLYSYREEQTIDFEHLSRAGLFGIFGKVGSGKSSILEAISLALYGETERLNRGDNRSYNMMNLKSDVLLIEFEFLAGPNKVKYLAQVKGRRNKKRHENISAYERSAYRIENGEYKPIEIEEIPEAIGLSYKHFKRTIIIPQGKFQEFLQLSDSERTGMMKELFNLERFELSFKTGMLESKNNEKINLIKGNLNQLQDIVPDLLEQLDNEKTELTQKIEKLNKDLETTHLSEVKMQKQKELHEKIKSTESEQKELLQKQPAVDKLKKKIEEYKNLNSRFKHLFELENNSRSSLSKLKTSISDDEKTLAGVSKNLTLQSDELKKVSEEFGRRDELIKTASELEKISNIKSLREKVAELDEKISETNNKLLIISKEREELNQNIRSYEAGLAEAKTSLPDTTLLSKAKEWHSANNQLRKESVELQNDIKELSSDIKNLYEQILASLGMLSTDISTDLENIEHLPAAINGIINSIDSQINDCEAIISKLSLNCKIGEYVRKLTAGEPCPLCGSEEHPSPALPDDLRKQLEDEKLRLSNLKSQRKTSENVLQNANKLVTTINVKNDGVRKLKNRLEACMLEIKTHADSFSWPEFSDESLLDEAFDKSTKTRFLIDNLEKKISQARKQSESKTADAETHSAQLNEHNNSKTKVISEINTLTKQIELLDTDKIIQHTADKLKAEAERLKKQYLEIERRHDKLSKETAELRTRSDVLCGRLDAMQKSHEEEISRMKEIEIKIDDELKKSGAESKQYVLEIISKDFDTETLAKQIEDFSRKLHSLEISLQNLRTESGESLYDAEKHNALKQQISFMKDSLSRTGKSLGDVESRLEHGRASLKAKLKLEEEMRALTERAENISTLKNLFRGSGFVKYISTVYLQNLIAAANARFLRLTRQSLGLELNNNNNFEVRDYLNGGLLRSVKTLSGGQTFQASLSLAIALADNIQRMNNHNQNFFFLDEGFGTLDKDTLSDVFDALKALRKENRIVGLISHVEEMQQEIETHISVELTGDGGSVVKESWK